MLVGNVNLNGVLPSATGITKAVTKTANPNVEKELAQGIAEMMPKSIGIIGKFSKIVGEVPNIIINALGTGLVAPIFIKYNFLSKTDDDTRTYSAWRQPISAMLSVVTQVGAVIPFDRLITNMSNKGQFLGKNITSHKYNKEAFQDIDYIKKTLKKENPSLTAQELDTLAQEKHTQNIQKIADGIKANGSIEYMAGGKKVVLSPSEVKQLLEQTTADMLSQTKDNAKDQSVIKKMQEAIKGNKSIKDLEEISKAIPESEFVTNVVKKHISNVGANLKGLRQVTGLVVSLATIPISCSILNTVYPKIMDALFPKLSKKKAPKDSDADAFIKAIDNSIHRGAVDSKSEVRK